MKTFLEAFENPPEPVNCGACPVNVDCALGNRGNGWTYSCCGVSAIDTDRAVIVVDCQHHTFFQCNDAKLCIKCPLCTGDIVLISRLDAAEYGGSGSNVFYVPTVHAKVPLKERLRLWNEKARNTP